MTFDEMPPSDADSAADSQHPGALAPLSFDATAATRTLTVRTPTDALALAPIVLGFHPQESLVVLTFGGVGFHARVDLPRDRGGREEVVSLLVRALQANPCSTVMVLLYSEDEAACRALAAALVPAVTDGLGLSVADVVRADGTHWWSLEERRGALGVPYDVSSHPFTAGAVLRGTVVHRDREAVAGLLEGGDPALARRIERALAEEADAPAPSLGPARRRLASWLREAVQEQVEDGALGSAEDLARILTLVRDPDLRDVVWGAVDRVDAPRHLSAWIQVLRVAPPGWEASPAALVGLYAWLSGDGALAWTAVERSLDAEPDNTLAGLVAEALDRAVPPSTWRAWGVEELLARHG